MILEPHELKKVYAKRGRAAEFSRATGMDYTQVMHILGGRNKNPTYRTIEALTVYAMSKKWFVIGLLGPRHVCIIANID